MKILIVDDSEHIQAQLKVILESAGYDDLIFADSAEKALSVLGVEGEADQIITVDLVLMDVQLEGIDGVEATRRIKEKLQFFLNGYNHQIIYTLTATLL